MTPMRLLLITSLLATPLPALAQGDLHESKPVVVTGTRTPHAYDDAPVETQVITEEEIQQQAGNDVSDVVGRLVGIRTSRRIQGEEAAVSIEGLPPNYTKILVNGRKYTGRVGGVEDLANIPLENVQQIEIVRGTAGTLYGSDALGGVINIITKRPTQDGYRANFTSSFGSDDEANVSGSGSFRAGDLGGTLSFSRKQQDGFERDEGVQTLAGGRDSRASVDDVYGLLELDVTESFRLNFDAGWNFENEHFRGFTPQGSRIKTRRRSTRWLGGGGFELDLGDSTQLRGNSRLLRNSIDTDVGRLTAIDEGEGSFEMLLTHYLFSGSFAHTLTLGSEVRTAFYRERTSTEGTPADAAIGNQDTMSVVPLSDLANRIDEKLSHTGVFAQLESNYKDWATLVLGARAEFHSRFDDRVVPSATLFLKPTDDVRLRFAISMGYEAPSLPQLVGTPVAQTNYFLAGNPELQPETTISHRVGLEWSPRPNFSLSTTWFLNRSDDYILRDDRERIFSRIDRGFGGTVFRSFNVDQVTTQGVETQLRYEPFEYLSLGIGWTLQKTEVNSQRFSEVKELPLEPRDKLDLSLTWRLPWTDTEIDFRSIYRGKAVPEFSGTGIFSFTQDGYTDDSWEHDVRITQPVTDRADVFVDFTNLTNTETVFGYAVRGFGFRVGVRGSFDGFSGGQ